MKGMNKLIKEIIKNEFLYGNIKIVKGNKSLIDINQKILNNEETKFDYLIIINITNNLETLISNTISKWILILDINDKLNYEKLFKKIKINKIYIKENFYVAIGMN